MSVCEVIHGVTSMDVVALCISFSCVDRVLRDHARFCGALGNGQ